jgi:hypothetical protein
MCSSISPQASSPKLLKFRAGNLHWSTSCQANVISVHLGPIKPRLRIKLKYEFIIMQYPTSIKTLIRVVKYRSH